MTTQMQLKVLFGRKSHGRPVFLESFRKKKQQQSRVFYTNVDNRERARASY